MRNMLFKFIRIRPILAKSKRMKFRYLIKIEPINDKALCVKGGNLKTVTLPGIERYVDASDLPSHLRVQLDIATDKAFKSVILYQPAFSICTKYTCRCTCHVSLSRCLKHFKSFSYEMRIVTFPHSCSGRQCRLPSLGWKLLLMTTFITRFYRQLKHGRRHSIIPRHFQSSELLQIYPSSD